MRSLPETQDWSIYRVAEPVSRAGLPSADLVDFGLRRDEIRRLALLSPEQLDRRNRMAHLSGLDPARLRGERALDIATALCCSDCAAEGRCSSAVDDGSAAVEAEFCVNSATFGALAAE